MDDREIVGLYWARSENAISQTAEKYGKYCHYIAFNILHSDEDSEECVNDTYMRVWDSIPPHRPNRLGTYLGKLTRNLALDRYRYTSRARRGGGQVSLVLEELGECVSGDLETERVIDEVILAECFDRFLGSLHSQTRKMFVRRYWHMSSVKDIADDFHMSESGVKITLFRARKELRKLLEKEGIIL